MPHRLTPRALTRTLSILALLLGVIGMHGLAAGSLSALSHAGASQAMTGHADEATHPHTSTMPAGSSVAGAAMMDHPHISEAATADHVAAPCCPEHQSGTGEHSGVHAAGTCVAVLALGVLLLVLVLRRNVRRHADQLIGRTVFAARHVGDRLRQRLTLAELAVLRI